MQGLNQLDQIEADHYNIGLGRLLRYLVLVTSCRLQDITLRREDRNRRKKERENCILEKQARIDRKEADREEAMAEVEEGEEFKADEWNETWDQDHPEIEIPDEVQDEIDIDLEPGYFEEEVRDDQ